MQGDLAALTIGLLLGMVLTRTADRLGGCVPGQRVQVALDDDGGRFCQFINFGDYLLRPGRVWDGKRARPTPHRAGRGLLIHLTVSMIQVRGKQP